MHTWLLLGVLLFSGLDGWDWLSGGRAGRGWGGHATTPSPQAGTVTAMDGDIQPPPPPK